MLSGIKLSSKRHGISRHEGLQAEPLIAPGSACNMTRMTVSGGKPGRVRHIRFREIIGPDGVFKIARAVIDGRSFWQESDHDHDFPEMFWVQCGAGLHLVNGRQRDISAGYLCMMRPSDRHNFYGRSDTPLAMMNIAFPPEALEHYRRRYFSGCRNYFWTRARLPYSARLDDSALRWLNESARELSAWTDSALVLDRFFAELFLLLEKARSRDGTGMPAWLREALERFSRPEHFRAGLAGFVQLAGRGREHVNRSLRRHLGMTTTEVVNRARMRWAADELRFTDRTILAICFDAGCGNVGHFYKLFRMHFGTTPKAWREHHRELGRRLL
jgi:AraC family cel operon transcriptional repressor